MPPLHVSTIATTIQHKTYRLTVRDTQTIHIPRTEHQFNGQPFLYAFYQAHPSGMILYTPAFRNPYPYGYDGEGTLFLKLAEPFTGDIVLTCFQHSAVPASPTYGVSGTHEDAL